MNADILQKRIARLVEKVRLMRYHQRQYFKCRARSDLDKAKYYEREVDKLLTDEIKIQQTNRNDLFNGETQ
jgi:hypothetical protein